MIKLKDKMEHKRIEIDLTGPEGNAFVLLAYAKRFAQDLKKDFATIRRQMTSGDYENLVKVFDEEFGEFVTLWR